MGGRELMKIDIIVPTQMKSGVTRRRQKFRKELFAFIPPMGCSIGEEITQLMLNFLSQRSIISKMNNQFTATVAR
jgi:5-methylthioribose kinase